MSGQETWSHVQVINKMTHLKLKYVRTGNMESCIGYHKSTIIIVDFDLIFGVLTPLSIIFQLYHGDQFQWWRKPEYPERTTDHGQATGKLYHLRLRVKCTLFCNLQSRARTHAVLVIGLYELLQYYAKCIATYKKKIPI